MPEALSFYGYLIEGLPVAWVIFGFGFTVLVSMVGVSMSGAQVMLAVFYVMILTAACFAIAAAITGMG